MEILYAKLCQPGVATSTPGGSTAFFVTGTKDALAASPWRMADDEYTLDDYMFAASVDRMSV